MFNRADRQRALTAERSLMQAQDAIAMLNHRPVLIDIEQSGRVLKFHFMRDGALTIIETYCTIGDDVDGWKKDLLG